jgi:hypothetical protein
MDEMIEYRASRIDVRKMNGGGMIVARTDKGQVVIYLTEPELQKLVRQTKLLPQDASDQPDRLWDNIKIRVFFHGNLSSQRPTVPQRRSSLCLC